MEISQISLAVFIAAAFIFGLLFGFLYDFMSPLPAICGKVYSEKLREKLDNRKKSKKEELKKQKPKYQRIAIKTAVFLHDVFYMVCFGAAFATLTYAFNDGIVRASALISATVGVFVYAKALRRLTLALAELVRFAIISVVRCVVLFLSFPFKAVYKLFGRVVRRIRKSSVQRYTARYSKKMQAEILLLAQRGFVLDFERRKNKRKGKYTNERSGKKEKNNNICNLVHSDGVGYCVSGESDELQSASQGSRSSRTKKRRA